MPEHSREFRFFTELLDKEGVEWVTVEFPRRAPKPKPKEVEPDMRPNLTCHKCRKQYPADYANDTCVNCGAPRSEIYV